MALQGTRGRYFKGKTKLLHLLFEAGKIHTQRHGYTVRSVLDGPLNGVYDLITRPFTLLAEHFANQCLLYSRRYPYACAVDIPLENGTGTVRAVPVLITVPFTREILLNDFRAGNRGM